MYKVLLVDDEIFVRKGLRGLIDWKECGYEIAGEAGNGKEALEWIEQYSPDLVITDIRMPVLTGLELISKVVEAKRDPMAFIILSGYEDFKYVQQAVRYDVLDYILKPVDEDELKAALLKLSEQLRAVRKPSAYTDTDQSLILALVEIMEENDAVAIQEAADLLFHQLQSRSLAGEAILVPLATLAANVSRTISDMDGKPEDLKALGELRRWNGNPNDIHALRQLIVGFAMEGADLIGRLRRDKLNGTIHKIKQHIENHFTDNISLRSIAAQYYMNPVYMGRLFRKTYGVYFNEFLLSMRMKEARKLLRQSELRIYEIAERTGFSSSNYFVAQFEKLERVTPSEYRNRLLHGQGGNGDANEKL